MESQLMQIKDPIQRVGVRLLWAAAIPIQTQARRFLARQAAIKRMCAVLTIQAVSFSLSGDAGDGEIPRPFCLCHAVGLVG